MLWEPLPFSTPKSCCTGCSCAESKAIPTHILRHFPETTILGQPSTREWCLHLEHTSNHHPLIRRSPCVPKGKISHARVSKFCPPQKRAAVSNRLKTKPGSTPEAILESGPDRIATVHTRYMATHCREVQSSIHDIRPSTHP